jgi:hypothetical protein
MGKPWLAPGLCLSKRTQCRRREEKALKRFGFNSRSLETPLLVPLFESIAEPNLQNFICL